MKNGFFSQHWVDGNGCPAGGVSSGQGFTISWQNGPLGRDGERAEPNGAFVEEVIAAAGNRIKFYEEASGGRFSCEENKTALTHLKLALDALNERTARRESAKTEGTNEGS